MSKKVAVLFSGGLDSTYLVWKNLKEGNMVFPIYVEIENNENKTILEKNRIELIWKELKKEFNESTDIWSGGNLRSIHYAIKVGVHANEGSLYFKQMPIWLFSVVFLQGMNVDEVQIGYVSNDDAISYLDDIQNIYKSYQAISEPMKPLVFPLTKKKKFDMASELPEQYRKLVVTCENPRIISKPNAEFIEYEPCCECVPCKTIFHNEYYGIQGFPDIYAKKWLDRYAEILYQKGYKIFDKENKEYADKWRMLEPEKKPYQLVIDFNHNDCDVQMVEKAEVAQKI